MMKGEIGIERISNHLVIIDAYIIDELNEKSRQLHDEQTAQLPCPHYDMDVSEKVADDEEEETIIIIEL